MGFRIPESDQEEIDWPAFGTEGRVHDWRNHIPYYVRENWSRLSVETRMVLYYMAKQQADLEEWD